jgi:hypothetical protein
MIAKNKVHKRGTGDQLTVKVPRNDGDRFNHPVLRMFTHIFPMYVLMGLRKPFNDRDKYALAEHFMVDSVSHTKVLNALYKYEEYVTNGGSQIPDVLDVIWTGAEQFDQYASSHVFVDENRDLMVRHKFDLVKVSKYFFHGFADRNWYRNTLATFKSELVGYDIELFVKLFALTSPRTNFKANLTNAFRAYALLAKGRNFRNKGFLPAVENSLEDFRLGSFDFNGEYRGGRRKISNFANAILGDKKAIVVDTWLLRAYGLQDHYLWRGKPYPYTPRPSEYDLIENHIRHLAEVCRYEPRQIVSMLWSGIRQVHSNNKVASTAALLKTMDF